MNLKISYLDFCVLFVLFVAGCTNSYNTAAIDLDKEDDVSVHDIFSDIRIVVPENHPDYLISVISSVVYHKGYYYIFDRKSQQVFCLDENGTFHYKISATGNGPEEYVYVTGMSIDKINDQILLLEPSMYRLQIFDLNGKHVQTYKIEAEDIMGYNDAIALNADTIVLISASGDQLIYFSRKSKSIIKTDFPTAIVEGVGPFWPAFYQFENSTFFLPSLGQEIFNISNMQGQPYFSWDFGINNNSENQNANLIKELSSARSRNMAPYDFVGQGKTINHNIIKIAETSRFRIAFVEYNSDYKTVIIDKSQGGEFCFQRISGRGRS
jgi:hypothetical protein